MEYVQLVNHLLTLDFLQMAHKKLLFPIFKNKNKNLPKLRLPISPYPHIHTPFPPPFHRARPASQSLVTQRARWKPWNLQAEAMVKM